MLRERLSRVKHPVYPPVQKRKSETQASSAKSPRTSYAFQSSEPSVPSSTLSSGQRFDLSQPRWAEGEEHIPPPTDASEDGALLSRERTPAKLGARNTFDDALKSDVIDLSNEFANHSSILKAHASPC